MQCLKIKYLCVKICKSIKLTFFEVYCLLFTGRTCLFDIVHSALRGSEYPVCMPDAQVLFLSGAHMLHMTHSAVQAHLGGV
jgi:hypothetical protein